MKYIFYTTPEFQKAVKRLNKKYKTIVKDLADFEKEFAENPNMGTDVGNGYRKIRMIISGKGKGKVVAHELSHTKCM